MNCYLEAGCFAFTLLIFFGIVVGGLVTGIKKLREWIETIKERRINPPSEYQIKYRKNQRKQSVIACLQFVGAMLVLGGILFLIFWGLGWLVVDVLGLPVACNAPEVVP